MSGSFWFLLQQFILLALAALFFTWLGWWLRGKMGKFGATHEEVNAERVRADAAEERVKQAAGEAKSAAAEIAALKVKLTDRSEIEKVQKLVAAEKEKAESLDSQLKKSREAHNAAEARINDVNKAAQAKIFEAQNELAKIREEGARSKQIAAQAEAEIAKAKSAALASSSEAREIGNQVIALRKEAADAIKACDEAKTARDNAVADLTAAKDKISKLTEELGQTKSRPGALAGAGLAAAAVAAPVVAAVQPRSVSEEQFQAVRSALNNAQKERDAALEAKEEASAKAEELYEKAAALTAELDQLKSASAAPVAVAAATTTTADGDAIALREAFAALEAAHKETRQAHADALEESSDRHAEMEKLRAEIAALKSGSADHAATSTQATTSVAEAGSASGVIDAASAPTTSTSGNEASVLSQELEALKAERDSLSNQLDVLKTNLEDSVAYRSGERSADDLKEIKGVADILNARLNAFGVFTYKQIAQWTAKDIDAFGKLLSFKDRITREDWQGQCREFHKAKYGEDLPA